MPPYTAIAVFLTIWHAHSLSRHGLAREHDELAGVAPLPRAITPSA